MKPIVLISVLFVVAMALGIAAGLNVGQSESVMAKVDVASVVLLGGLLLFSMWHRNRAKPDSPDRQSLSTMMMVFGALLLGAMPRVVWPDGGWQRLAASVFALCVSIGILIWVLRVRRRQRTAE
jgi:hypothetical protein